MKTRRLVALWLTACGMLIPASSALAASGTTERISIDGAGNQGDSSSFSPAISANGRYVAFISAASNLVPGDNNGTTDVFVHDRQAGTTERVSVDSAGNEANGQTDWGGSGGDVAISADGRFVAFASRASNLVPGDTNGSTDLFVHDRQTGATERVSVDSAGNQSTTIEFGVAVAISGDGRYVAFRSYRSDLVPGDTNGSPCCRADIFVRDRQAGTTERVSVNSAENEAAGDNAYPSISADGRYVAFLSSASNLVSGDGNGTYDAFVRDRQAGTTERVSVDGAGNDGNGASGITTAISGGGRYVAFGSDASNLVPGDTNGTRDSFVRDRQAGTTERVSVDSAGNEGNGRSLASAISADGRFVSFGSYASNLVPGDTNDSCPDPNADPDGPPAPPINCSDVFVHDRQSGTTERVSVDSAGNEGNDNSPEGDIDSPAISADGGVVAFGSFASNLVPGDTNGTPDVFARDRGTATFADGDGDGIEDSIDTQPATASDAFADGAGNSGSITDRAGLDVRVADLSAPDGVRVTVGAGTGEVSLSVCSGFSVTVAAGSTVDVTCGSVKIDVIQGSAKVVLGGGLTVISVPEGVTAKVSDNGDGSFKVENLGGGDVTVTVDGVTTTVGSGETSSVTAWDFRGFTAPVDNPNVLNVLKAGQAVPLKWRLVRSDGTAVTNLSTAKLTVSSLDCDTATTPDAVEEVASGASGLQNLGNGYYQLNWKSPKSYAGSCKTLHLDIGEGVTRDAYFKLVK